MTKNIAVKGCVLTFSVGTGTATITTSESTTTKINGNGVYSGPLSISVSNFADPTTQIVQGMGGGVINPSATKTSVDGNNVVLEGDSCDVLVNGVHAVSGMPLSQTVNVKISNAGQTIGVAE